MTAGENLRSRPLGTGAAGLAAAAIALWFLFGMHRGLLLSEEIKSRIWPWGALYPAASLTAPALSDPVWQFVPWLDFAAREIRQGRLPLWNPHQDGGVPLLGNGVSALGSPLNWPALLLGIVPGWNLSLLLRLLLALAGTYLWLRDRGRSRPAALLGANAFALSGPFIAWLEHPQTTTAAAIPMLLLFTGRLAREITRRDLAGLTLATYFVLSGGHPETQLMAAILAAGYAAIRAERPKLFLAPLSGALLGAGLASPLLLPFLEYFRLSQARLNIGRQPFVLPLSDLLRFFRPHLPGSNVIESAAAVSVTLLLLVPFGLLTTRRDRETRFWTLVASCVFLVAYANPLSRALAGATPIYWTRALLLLPLALGFLASAGLDALRPAIAQRFAAGKATAAAGLLAACATAELLCAARGVHAVTPYSRWRPTTPLIETLRVDPEVFRVLPLHTFLPPNAATDWGLDDIRGYDALSPQGWRIRREAIGAFRRLPTVTDAVAPWDLSPGGRALDFWNVKYLLLHPQFTFGAEKLNKEKDLALEEIFAGPDGRILRNRRVLPRVRLEAAGEVRILERQATLWRIAVAAESGGRLIVANPYFPGWKARLDQKVVSLSAAPGEAISIWVPAGRHEVVLFYRPASFLAGIGLALLCGGALVAIILRKAQSRASSAPSPRGRGPG